MIYKRKTQSRLEKTLTIVSVIFFLITTGIIILRFIYPNSIDNGDNGIRFIELPGEAEPDLETGVKEDLS